MKSGIKKKNIKSESIKLEIQEKGKILGRVFLYLIKNNLHKEPYGFLEDLFVSEESRGNGLGGKLLRAAILEAKKKNCYKLIGTSRNSRKEVHKFYKKFGFKKYGFEFRMNMN